MDFIITTDTTADLSKQYLEDNKIDLLSLKYMIDDVTYDIENELPDKEFYNKMREGAIPKTSQANPETAKEFFKKNIEKNKKDILHVGFSSGLSGTYDSARVAAEEVMEEIPGIKIIVIDSLAASLGQGLLVHKAIKLQEEGKTIDEVAKWLEDNKLNLCHFFTVDDLIYLYRGGRVSKTSQVAAGVLNIKPVLHVDNEGHLVALSKTRGRKKSIKQLADMMEKRILPGETDVFISHGDCLEEAQGLADHIKERFGIEVGLLNYVGPTIGAHSGPGTIALFFLGSER